ncbi:MAG: hypothetical protein J5509_03475 [Lachnospiraceae bacterium]|nr:hypothetical protein [Lachnospiraceae bacterium]
MNQKKTTQRKIVRITSYICTFISGVICTFGGLLSWLKRIPSNTYAENREKEKVKILSSLLRFSMEGGKIDINICPEYSKIGIYGAGDLGQILLEMFMQGDKPEVIKCFIDRCHPKFEINGIEWRKPTDTLDDLDLVIITPYDPYGVIRNDLRIQKSKIMSMSDFVMRILYEK